MQDHEKFWKQFLGSGLAPHDADARFYGTFGIGDTAMSREHGAELILRGAKTATSSLLADYDDAQRPPQPGDFSIVIGGTGNAVCIIETKEVWIAPFSDATEAFAFAYGEWDQSLDTWRQRNSAYYSDLCRKKGIAWSEEPQLVFEIFKLAYTQGGEIS